MPQRLEVLAFLQEAAANMRQMARARPSSVSVQMIHIADEIAQEAARLEMELLESGLLDAKLSPMQPK